LPRTCVNDGGDASLIALAEVPVLERPTPLSVAGGRALDAWRSRLGEIVTVRDPLGAWYRARLVERGTQGVVVPFQCLERAPESALRLVVCQALPAKERFELILQKLTELGAARVVPYVSRRSTDLAGRDAGQKKSHRWPEVVLRAARQCRRAVIPELGAVADWTEVLAEGEGADCRLLLYEGEASLTLGEVLRRTSPRCVVLTVGPEGGFTAEEVNEARAAGFIAVSLGPRILRTETAAIVGAALVQHLAGDLA
jgi:16S rRNA (uracil1498-N3)-methyltransferase